MGLGELTEFIGNKIEQGKQLIANNPIAAVGIAAAGGAVGGAGAARIIGARKRRKKKTRRKSSTKGKGKRKLKFGSKAYRKKYLGHTRRGLIQDRKRRSKQKHELAYQKRKRKSHSRRKKPARLVKGSRAAKAYMAKLRRMRK